MEYVDELNNIYKTEWNINDKYQDMLVSRVIISNMFQFVGLTDPTGILLEANIQALRIAGLDPKEVIGKPVWEAYWFQVDVDTVAKMKDGVYRASQGENIRFDLLINAPIANLKGVYMWIDLVISPIKNSNGEIVFLIPEARNIDDQKRADLALLQEKLKVDDALRAKSDFMANMTHELRTPLNGIKGITDLLLSEDLDVNIKNSLKLIYDTSENLAQLINQILNYSAFEQNKVTVSHNNFNIKDLIDKTVLLLRNKKKNKDINIIVDVPDKWIKTDKMMIGQITMNIIGNALKYTDKGYISINANLIENKLSFRIEDTGIGMTEDQLSRIFDKFYRVDNLRNSKYVGSGLGLSILQKSVELLGGDTKIESVHGIGTTVSFSIDVEIGDPEIISDEINAFDDSLGKDFPMKILVADDNYVNRFVLVSFLRKFGYLSVDQAENGTEVLNLMKKNNYDLILMDIRMPILDGIETAKIILSEYSTRTPYMVAVTANTLESDISEYLDIGFSDHIGKPFSRFDLKKCLHKVIEMISLKKQIK